MSQPGTKSFAPPTVLLGREALAMALDARFAAEWLALYDACTWATVGQHPQYVGVHWRVYHDQREPILVFQRDAEGTLVGLLALYRDGNKLVGGGEGDCEYHVWLSSAEHAPAFMPAALKALRSKIGKYELALEYIPPDVPLDWANGDPSVSGWTELVATERRIIRTKANHDILNNFQGKTRLKRKNKNLEKLGKLEFRFVTDPQDYERVLDAFVPLFDFRKGAMYGAFAFRDHPHRRQVLRELFNVPGLLCVGVLELDGKVLAAHIGIDGKGDTFTLGGSAHDEFYAKYSTGMILQMQLFRAVQRRGYALVDLTPGDDLYKVHWGNDVQIVHKLFVRTSSIGQGVSRVRRAMKAAARSVLNRLPAKESTSDDGTKENPTVPMNDVPLYRPSEISSAEPTRGDAWQVNKISDVLAHPSTGKAYWAFLKWVHPYIRNGATVYTQTSGGKLSAGWLLISAEDALGNAVTPDRPPAEAWLLISLSKYLPDAPSAEQEKDSLQSVLDQLFPEVRQQTLVVVQDVAPDRAAERLGLKSTDWRIPMTADGQIVPPRPVKAPPTPDEAKPIEAP